MTADKTELKKAITLDAEIKALVKLCFAAEAVAHLRGYEKEILPLTEAIRALASKEVAK